jgi:hypothetical protein
MENELTTIEQSTDFLCPNCGASAFEVLGTQWEGENGSATEGGEVLVMRCLDCLHLFCHRLEEEPSEVAASEPQGFESDGNANEASVDG